MNRTELIGNVTKDIELNTTSTKLNYCNFSLAVRRRYPDKDGNEIVDFHNCAAFSKLAETLAKYVKKGNKLFVAGELIYDTYENKEGTKKTIAKIMVEQVEFLTPKSVNGVIPESAEGNSRPEELTPIDDDSLPF